MSISKKNGIPSGWKIDDRDLLKQKPKGIRVRNNSSYVGVKVFRKRKYMALKNKNRFSKEDYLSNETASAIQKYRWRSKKPEQASGQNYTKNNLPQESVQYKVGSMQSNQNAPSSIKKDLRYTTYKSSQKDSKYSTYDTSHKVSEYNNQNGSSNNYGRSIYVNFQNNTEQTTFMGIQTGIEQTTFLGKNSENTNVFFENSRTTNGISSQIGGTSKMIDVSTNAVPPIAIAKKGVEISKQMAAKVIHNLQQHHELNKQKEKSDKSDTPDITAPMAAIGVAMFLLMAVACTTSSMLIVGTFAPVSIGAILPAVASVFFETETTIIDVAKQEYENYEDNIGGEKYKEYFGYSGNWCAMFVSWCANECGYIDAEIMPKQASVQQMAGWYKDREQWRDKDGYTPKAGDIVFFQNGMSHVGIVIAYDSSTSQITTIEGNTGSSSTEVYHEGSRVQQKKYSVTYTKITGYGLPNYPLSEDEETTEETEK